LEERTAVSCHGSMLRVTMWAGLREALWGGFSLGRTITEAWVRVKRSATLRLAKEAKVLPASEFQLPDSPS
jgi:hypothetical protein